MNKIFSEIKVGVYPPHTNMTFERFGNEIIISFYDLEKFKKLTGYDNRGTYHSGGTGPQQFVSGVLGVMNQIGTSIAYNHAAESSGGTLDQLAASDRIIVELAFRDGGKGYVDLTPQNVNLVSLMVPLFKTTAHLDSRDERSRDGAGVARPNWCSRAASNVELLICDTPKLAAAENKMTALYTELKNSPNPPVLLSKEQTAFLSRRNACEGINEVFGKIACLDDVYSKRIEILQSR